MAEISAELWDNMLDVLKDVSNILQKEDTSLSIVKLEERPKTGESQNKKDPIKGGESSGKPGADVIVSKAGTGETEGRGEGGEETKEDENTEDEKSEEAEKETGDTEGAEKAPSKAEIQQLMLLLKDIKTVLNSDRSVIAKAVLADVQKALPSMLANEEAKMLRKMGFQPSRADIGLIGIDDVGASQSQSMTADIKKSEPEITEKMSWGELAARRERLGGFNLF